MIPRDHKALLRKIDHSKGKIAEYDFDELRCLAHDDAEVVVKLIGRVNELTAALLAVSAGIWRDKKANTCGLAGGSFVVHAVEHALGKRKLKK